MQRIVIRAPTGHARLAFRSHSPSFPPIERSRRVLEVAIVLGDSPAAIATCYKNSSTDRLVPHLTKVSLRYDQNSSSITPLRFHIRAPCMLFSYQYLDARHCSRYVQSRTEKPSTLTADACTAYIRRWIQLVSTTGILRPGSQPF